MHIVRIRTVTTSAGQGAALCAEKKGLSLRGIFHISAAP